MYKQLIEKIMDKMPSKIYEVKVSGYNSNQTYSENSPLEEEIIDKKYFKILEQAFDYGCLIMLPKDRFIYNFKEKSIMSIIQALQRDDHMLTYESSLNTIYEDVYEELKARFEDDNYVIHHMHPSYVYIRVSIECHELL